MISRETAGKIVNVLTDAENNPVNARFKYWARNRFNTMAIGDTIIVIEQRTKKPICIQEELYDIIGNYYVNIQHGGYRKTYSALNIKI